MAHDTDCVSISIMLRADGTVRKTRRSLNIAGHAHELTFCCYRRLPLLSKERTCRWFLEALDNARTRWDEEFETLLQHPELSGEQVAELLPRRTADAVAVVREGIHAYHSGMDISMLSRMMRHRLDEVSRRVRCPRCGDEI